MPTKWFRIEVSERFRSPCRATRPNGLSLRFGYLSRVGPAYEKSITSRNSRKNGISGNLPRLLAEGHHPPVSLFAHTMNRMAKKKKDLTLREHLKTIQSDGGKARWANLTPEERSAQARKIVAARWAKNAGTDAPKPRASKPAKIAKKKSTKKK